LPTTIAPSWRRHAAALAAYAAVALLFVWPLPQHMGTHVTGPPTGDTGVYLWNLWVFQHELFANGQFPLFTSTILSLDWRVDLALHNYTVFADALALPFVRLLGLVATFNLIYIALTIITAYSCFLLARSVSGKDAEAWLAGLVFAWSPALLARGSAHFSLVAAAPLPIFMLTMLAAERTGQKRYMVAAGLTIAWAAYCDPYYAVYCLMLGVLHVGARCMTWTSRRDMPSPSLGRARRLVDAALLIVAALAGWILVTGGGVVRVGGLVLSVKGLYTPVLLLTMLAVGRLWLIWRPALSLRIPAGTARMIRLAPYAAVAGIAALMPVLVALAIRVAEGRYVSPRIFWRSSTPGVDLLAFLLPNPNNPLSPDASRAWLSSLNGGFVENVASIPWVALAIIVVAAIMARNVLSRYWLGLSLVAVSLAVGPFIRLAGLETYIPGPWSLLRYVPVFGSARAPARFTVLVMMGVAMLFALALTSIGRAHPRWRRAMIAVVAVMVIGELLPAPRQLYSAQVPRFYDLIASDPSPVRVLELPFGIRDGLSSAGDFNASSQYYQTRHGKQLIGGYLSRVSSQRIEQNRRRPVLRALMLLSQGEPLPPELAESAARQAGRFAAAARVGYVVVDHRRASPELAAFASRVFDLELMRDEGDRSLYRVRGSRAATLVAVQ